MPRTLRVDGNHSGAEHERLGRPVVAHDFQGGGAVEDVDQLVARGVPIPNDLCPRTSWR